MSRLLGLEGLRLTPRGEAVRDYAAAALGLFFIAVGIIAAVSILKMIGF